MNNTNYSINKKLRENQFNLQLFKATTWITVKILRISAIQIRTYMSFLTCFENWDDFTFSFVRRRGQSDDGFTFPVKTFRCASDKIYLTPESWIHSRTDRIGTDLTCQVDFNTRIDGRHLRVSRNDTWK